MSAEPRAKACASCGREFAWRHRWAKCWGQVRYCSERCRRNRVRRVDLELEDAIRALLRDRAGTICPAEAAREVGQRNWRGLLEPARAAGRRMAKRDEIVVLQRGKRVDPTRAAGPIRFGRGSSFPAA